MRIPCTCGCGAQVTHATRRNHLNGRGKTSLRARVLEEVESLKTSTRQQPALLWDHQKKKRSIPSSNQIGNSKRLKVAQLEVTETPLQEDADPIGSGSLSPSVPNEESEILLTHAYTDPMESPPTPVPNQVPEFPIQRNTDPTELPLTPVPNQLPEIPNTDPTELPLTPVPNQLAEIPPVQACTVITESSPTHGFADALSFARRSNRIAKRTKEVTEQRWGNSHLQDGIPRSDHGGRSDRSEDEEDVDLNMTGDEDREDDDEDREDDDDDPFFESDVTGISAWDLLGEGFEHEVASIGMFLAHDPSVLLTIV